MEAIGFSAAANGTYEWRALAADDPYERFVRNRRGDCSYNMRLTLAARTAPFRETSTLVLSEAVASLQTLASGVRSPSSPLAGGSLVGSSDIAPAADTAGAAATALSAASTDTSGKVASGTVAPPSEGIAPGEAPYSASFRDIAALVASGGVPPGIQTLPDVLSEDAHWCVKKLGVCCLSGSLAPN